MDQDARKLYVYDKEKNEILSDWSRESVIEDVLTLKLVGKDAEDSSAFENAVYNKDRFIFFTKEDIHSLLLSHFSVRNPIVDNQKFQDKFKFNSDTITKDKLSFRMDLLKEEYEETVSAYANNDPEELVDGLIDLVVIALGTLEIAGVDVNQAWSEVYRANMSKERGIKPGREQSGGFDVIKPTGWKGPDHSDNHGDLEKVMK